eukprot:CAMPEP_0173398630 /NCGR_PEP_ID=MMETSP1356-20130122/42316_1 /TAXON_ID=77927 ORGANISM="Hemiselmis virescens, Strain PCC157" /NCGR_SAMPLE_ID=MMETSP1356 /ASSEMBLY_ACC=CAM_ASM_000847 /LENGTH=327 /DNA_ID=CAMNT_0014358165 /DNA_START=1 /DNA_END=984 /DNA_ORIENTATION=-
MVRSSLPLPTGIVISRRSLMLSSTVKWLIIAVLGSGLVLSARYWNNHRKRIDKSMPCNAATETLPVLDAENLKADQLAKYQGKPVLMRGTLQADDLADKEFGLTFHGIYLRRSIEMFQWTKDGSEYHKHWYPYVIDSMSFTRGHLNPLLMPFHDEEHIREKIFLHGSIAVSPLLIPQFSFAHRVPITALDLERLPEDLQGTFRVVHDQFFRGRDIHYPSIGDVRVHFAGIGAVNVTILATLNNKELVPCPPSSKSTHVAEGHIGESALVVPGILDQDEMRTAFFQSIDHGLGIPWWLYLLGVIHVACFAVLGYFAFFTQRIRDFRSD